MLVDGPPYMKGSVVIAKLTDEGADLTALKLALQNIPTTLGCVSR